MNKLFKVFVTVLVLLPAFLLIGCQNKGGGISTIQTDRVVGVKPEKLGTIDRDVVFGRADYIPLKMDIYYPKVAAGTVPALIYVHGGGWVGGDKSEISSGYTGELTSRGYLVASINYRLAPQYKFPAQIEDVKCAVRFLRAWAADYGIDTTRIGAIGASAGGHLVSLLGLTPTKASFEGAGGWHDQSSQVQAVVDLFGPTDLNALFSAVPPSATLAIFGASDSKTLSADSPVSYVSKDSPPFLILQGDKDMVVPPSQSQLLYDALVANNVPASLVIVKNAGHGFAPSGGPIEPSMVEISKMVADFFDKYL